MKYATVLIFLEVSLLCYQNTFAQWSNDPSLNTPVCVWDNNQQSTEIISDYKGGAIIAWFDFRFNNPDIFIQRIDEQGYPLWGDGGKVVCTDPESQLYHRIIEDEAGGCIITWWDYRNGNADIYAQRVDSAGNILWDSSGVPICVSLLDQEDPQIVTDGSGGAIIMWEFRQGAAGETGLYAQRINSAGQPMWGINGVPVATSPFPDPIQLNPKITDDGSGGAIIVWTDFSGTNGNIYAQRISSSGNILWPQNGLPICTTAANKRFQDIINVGSEEFVVSWNSNVSSNDWELRAQKINTVGNILWNINGLIICSPNVSFNPSAIVYDNNSSVVFAWEDRRTNPPGTIYCQKVGLDGTIHWQQNGLPVSTVVGFQLFPNLVSDSEGNTVVCWRGGSSTLNIYAQKFDASGNRLWETEGMDVCIASGNQDRQKIIITSNEDFIVSWDDERNTDWDIYAQSIDALVTAVNNSTSDFPKNITLKQNYPNPFNPSTKISWQVPVGSWQTLKVYAVLGNEVATLVDEYKPAGNYEVDWNASGLPSGVYFYQLKAGEFISTNKMILIK